MNTKATATLHNGIKVKGQLTTDHAASSYNQPVFVGEDNRAYNWAEIVTIVTTGDRSKGGQSTSDIKQQASRVNGRKGGRPRKI